VSARNYGQYCGVAAALDQVGERWALLIVRDLLVGPRRYGDLKQGLPRIPTNILSSRLKELQAAGIVRRVPLAHGLVYELTDDGRGLEDIVLALGRWGFRRMGEPREGDVITPDSMTMAFRTAFRPDAAAGFPATRYEAHLGAFALALGVEGPELAVTRVREAQAAERSPDLRFAAGPGIRGVISGELLPAAAMANGTVAVLDGDPALLDRFARTFHLEPAA
jgi:DNA-binding HxlR family transcriptional regulator